MPGITVGEVKKKIDDLDLMIQSIVDMLEALEGDTEILAPGFGDCTPFLDNGMPTTRGCLTKIVEFDSRVTVSVLLNTISKIHTWLCDVRDVIEDVDQDMSLPPSPDQP